MSLEIVSIDKNTMKLVMSVMDIKLHFSYIKTNKVFPLCALYEKSLAEMEKDTAFKEARP